jgi:tRNA pseudouridine38-40 synthase
MVLVRGDAVKLKLTIAYDGSGFQGSQLQIRNGVNHRTVQRELEAVIGQLIGQPVRVTLAGRTDSGVHASGQVVSFTPPTVGTATRLKLDDWQKALNAQLPPDLRVLVVEQMGDEFNPRFDAKRREYEYCVWNGAVLPPLLRFDTLLVDYPLDIAAMQAACQQLVGSHDFAAFAGSTGRGAEAKPASTVREMYLADCQAAAQQYGQLITVQLAANAFLAHMARNIVGTMLIVGRGRMSVAEFAAVLASGNRRLAGPTAPSQGLTLVRVLY